MKPKCGRWHSHVAIMRLAWLRKYHGKSTGSSARGRTFFQPMVSAFSRKSRRVMLRPYLRMIPCWFPEHLCTSQMSVTGRSAIEERTHHQFRFPAVVATQTGMPPAFPACKATIRMTQEKQLAPGSPRRLATCEAALWHGTPLARHVSKP